MLLMQFELSGLGRSQPASQVDWRRRWRHGGSSSLFALSTFNQMYAAAATAKEGNDGLEEGGDGRPFILDVSTEGREGNP